jgi:hypothetical protein
MTVPPHIEAALRLGAVGRLDIHINRRPREAILHVVGLPDTNVVGRFWCGKLVDLLWECGWHEHAGDLTRPDGVARLYSPRWYAGTEEDDD